MKALNTISTLISRRPTQLVAFGVLMFAVQVACGTDPPAPMNTPFPTAGTGTGGTPGASGSATAGSFNTSGTGFGTAGTETGGTGGAAAGTGGTGGAGTAGTATAGTGGTPVVIPPLDCTNTGEALPIPLVSKWGFPDSGDDSFSETVLAGSTAACTAAGLPETSPGCWSVAWTPTVRLYVHWYWHNATGNWSGQGICVAAGAKAVTFKAKGDSAFKTTFAAAGVEKIVDVTTEWQDVVIDIAGAPYNTRNLAGGVNEGFVVVMAREAADTVARKVYFYDVNWVVDVPVGGEGGSGAGGDSGMGGGEN